MLQCRDTLALLEERYERHEDSGGQADDLARLQRLVVAYSRLVAALREYIEFERMGTPFPRKLADRIEAFVTAVEAEGPEPGVSPGPEEGRHLAHTARRAD